MCLKALMFQATSSHVQLVTAAITTKKISFRYGDIILSNGGENVSNSIIQPDEKECFVTGSRINLDKHHCMHGPNRTLAERYGLWVWLRHDVHMELHDKNKELDRQLEQIAQKAFEKKYSHDLWMTLFRKNYL